MHIKSSFLGLAATGAMFLSAVPAIAATPQQILTNNLSNLKPENGINLVGEVQTVYKETLWAKSNSGSPSNVNATIKFDYRMPPKTGDIQNTEGGFAVSKAEMTESGEKMQTTDPLAIRWKYVAPVVYGKLEKISDLMVEAIKPNLDLTPYIGQWTKVEIPAQALSQLGQTGQAGEANSMIKEIINRNLVQTGRTLKTMTNQTGDKIIRVQLNINRGVLTKEYRKNVIEARKIKNRAERTVRLNELYKEYAEMLKNLGKVKGVAHINLTSERVERIEVSVATNEPKKDCQFNSKGKEVCKTVGRTNVNVLAGLTFLPIDSSPVVAPESALTLQAIQDLLK
jgi:hypothetical protein